MWALFVTRETPRVYSRNMSTVKTTPRGFFDFCRRGARLILTRLPSLHLWALPDVPYLCCCPACALDVATATFHPSTESNRIDGIERRAPYTWGCGDNDHYLHHCPGIEAVSQHLSIRRGEYWPPTFSYVVGVSCVTRECSIALFSFTRLGRGVPSVAALR